jgi:sugar transferase EpsL
MSTPSDRAAAARRPIGDRIKRIVDLTLVVFASPVWLPILCALIVATRLALGSPVLFRQQRIGRFDVPFLLVKLRTMTDARDAHGALLPDERRLTGFGRFLRASSLDELPELLNVLRGEMSLVGPRPLLPQYLPLYSGKHRHRHDVLPGLTGLAQVSGRNALSWEARLDLDVQYVSARSLRLDMAILFRTIHAVVRRHGISAAGEATMSAFNGYDAPQRATSLPGDRP